MQNATSVIITWIGSLLFIGFIIVAKQVGMILKFNKIRKIILVFVIQHVDDETKPD